MYDPNRVFAGFFLTPLIIGVGATLLVSYSAGSISDIYSTFALVTITSYLCVLIPGIIFFVLFNDRKLKFLQFMAFAILSALIPGNLLILFSLIFSQWNYGSIYMLRGYNIIAFLFGACGGVVFWLITMQDYRKK